MKRIDRTILETNLTLSVVSAEVIKKLIAKGTINGEIQGDEQTVSAMARMTVKAAIEKAGDAK